MTKHSWLERDFGRRIISIETFLDHAQFHIQQDDEAYWILNDIRTSLPPETKEPRI